METDELKPMEAAMGTWREIGGAIVLTENLNGFGDGRDGIEAEPGKGKLGIVVHREGDWVDNVSVVTVGCPTDTDAFEGTVDITLERKDIVKQNEGKLLGGFIWGDGGTLCDAEEEDEFEDQATGRKWGELDPATRTGEHFGDSGRADRRRCEDALKEGDGGVLDGDVVFFREVLAESGNVATAEECGADECVWLEGGGLSEREGLEGEADEIGEGMYADMDED